MKPIQVSQINRYIKTVLQNDPLLSNISVVGEISNLKYHGSGHVYFSLKDRNGRISCFLSSDKVKYLRYPLEDGMEIIATGYIYLFEKGGSYSLNVRDITIEGEGNLSIAFERLKKKLEEEGLFSQEFKKELPSFPKRIGIATSATGAAVWDMIRTIRNKNDYVDIIVCPCLVQGDGAAGDIEDAITALNIMEEPPDIIIIGRGGGSSEELWAFNEERVARAVFRSRIPVISAVGHETDFTISDFVADFRAATPTAAAEMAVPDTGEINNYMDSLINEMRFNIKGKLEYFENYTKRYSPDYLLEGIQGRIESFEIKAEALFKDVLIAFKEKLYSEELKIEKLKSRVDSMDPKNIMKLGYGAVTDSRGRYIKSIKEISSGDTINVYMVDGSMECNIINVKYRDIDK